MATSFEEGIRTAAKEMDADEARAARSRKKWEDLVYDGNTKRGITYESLAELSKKSRSRIDQVLRKVRKRRAQKG